MDLIRPAALPLEAASRLNFGMISADDLESTLEKVLEDSANKLLYHWAEFCLRLPGSAAAVASGVYAYKSIKVIAAGEPFAFTLSVFIFWASASVSFYKLSSMARSLLADKVNR